MANNSDAAKQVVSTVWIWVGEGEWIDRQN
jgi:hypothetical protein